MQSRKLLRVATRIITGFLIIYLGAVSAFSREPVPSADAEDNEKTYYFLTDHLGSVDAVLDEDGNVVERRDYLPYGSQRAVETFNGVPITELGFTGKELDSETGLNYYGARYYDPITGRFITMDPLLLNLDKMSQAQRNAFLSNPQNLNMYSYVQNNPVRYTDPTGMYEEDVHYDLTYVLAVVAGLPQNTAEIIASADQNMDVNPGTAPANYETASGSVDMIRNFVSGTTAKYHFQPRSEANALVLSSIEEKSAEKFGSALHTYQDSYSHEDYILFANHAIAGHQPDKTYNDPNKANEMAKNTFYHIRNFLLNTGEIDLTPVQFHMQSDEMWGKISSDVNVYNSEVNKLNTNIHALSSGSKQEIKANK